MEEVVERVKKIADGYSPTEGANRLKRLRALMAAINGCRKYIEEHSQEDRGCAQRIVRELHEVLAVLPSLRSLAYDKQAVNKMHTRKVAEEQLDLMKQEI